MPSLWSVKQKALRCGGVKSTQVCVAGSSTLKRSPSRTTGEVGSSQPAAGTAHSVVPPSTSRFSSGRVAVKVAICRDQPPTLPGLSTATRVAVVNCRPSVYSICPRRMALMRTCTGAPIRARTR